MNTRLLIPALMCLALAACGGGGKTPSEIAGTWGADCSSPFVKFDGDTIHVYPDNADYDLKDVKHEGNVYTVSYDSASGAVVEDYVLENGMLRLDKGSYGSAEATWHKQPMKKC